MLDNIVDFGTECAPLLAGRGRNALRRIKIKNMVSIQNTFGLPLLIAAAVFSTSRLLFWDKEVSDWVGYVLVHLLATATIWSVLKIFYRLPDDRQDFEADQKRRPRSDTIRLLIMIVLLLVTAAAACVELMSGTHPMFK